MRRNDGNFIVVRGANLDNRWVVPYNPYLLKKYNAHINVEACTSPKSVKYLYKYIYKGHDMVTCATRNIVFCKPRIRIASGSILENIIKAFSRVIAFDSTFSCTSSE